MRGACARGAGLRCGRAPEHREDGRDQDRGVQHESDAGRETHETSRVARDVEGAAPALER